MCLKVMKFMPRILAILEGDERREEMIGREGW